MSSKNAYAYFVDDYVARKRKEGIIVPEKEKFQLAGPAWAVIITIIITLILKLISEIFFENIIWFSTPKLAMPVHAIFVRYTFVDWPSLKHLLL